ncbi:sorting nexin-16 [Silurus asotus]|uniref:Sorting nexin-16 n=1 Tax=Silurus asotus TaxID=30991 RepID=A0AAD5A9N7_SILAS|nr:sorting nexin-16 [Silurus asotus]
MEISLTGRTTHSYRRSSSLGSLPDHARKENKARTSTDKWSDRPPVPTLLGYEVMEERAKFTVYKVLVRRAPDESWVVFRRYTDFVRLNDKLREMFPKFRLSLPPKRRFKDNYDMNFLEERQQGLQAFLQNLVAQKDITNSEVVRGFLCLDDPPGPFDSLEESKVYCETLEDTNHRLQRELQDKEREINSLRRILEDRELQISRLEKTKKRRNLDLLSTKFILDGHGTAAFEKIVLKGLRIRSSFEIEPPTIQIRTGEPVNIVPVSSVHT